MMEKTQVDTKTRFVAIVTSLLRVIPLGTTGAKIDIGGYEWITKNRYIFSCETNNDLCMFYALWIAKNGYSVRDINGKVIGSNSIQARAKELFRQFYNLSKSKLNVKLSEFQGLPIHEEQDFCNFFNANMVFYYTEPDKQKYDIVGSVNTNTPNDDTITLNLLRIPIPDATQFHVM
jgi:hypothetical protein